MLLLSPFVNLEESIHPLVDKLSICTPQQIIQCFVFCNATMMLHPLLTVFSLPFIIVVFKDTKTLGSKWTVLKH